MKIIVTSIFVQDQDKALEFYTEKLGFVKKEDVPMGKFRWITLVSQDDIKTEPSFYSNRMNILPPRSIKRRYSQKASHNNVWRCRYSKRVQTINGTRR